MSCYGCATTFGLWTTEKGCPACGFGYCNSCLKYKCAVPKLNGKVSKVCKKCFSTLTGSSEMSSLDTPSTSRESFDVKKQLQDLDAPLRPPITVYGKDISQLHSVDLHIAQRLRSLKEIQEGGKPKPIPSEDEIARRLAVLRGVANSEQAGCSNYALLSHEKRTVEQQINDIQKQCLDEIRIDFKRSEIDDEIAERLHRLKLRASSTNETEKIGENSGSDDDEEKAAAKIIAKAEAEWDLVKRSGGQNLSDDEEVMDSDREELPWCIICNDDAKVRCLGCDRDLYCKSCFQEGHRDSEMRSHIFEPFKK